MFDSKKIIADVCANNVCQWHQASTPEVLSASETNIPLKADGHLTHAEDPDPPRSCAFHGSDCPLNTSFAPSHLHFIKIITLHRFRDRLSYLLFVHV